MVRAQTLALIGYWHDREGSDPWPDPQGMVDEEWDAEERDQIADYLGHGLVARTYMGYSECRICGRQNGCIELSDGVFVWPDGLEHYVRDHHVRLPQKFVSHALDTVDLLESASRDASWWESVARS